KFMDLDALENAITEKTKVIIPVDLAGKPCKYDEIFEIVERKNSLFKPNNKFQEKIGRVIVMADAAHSLGAVYKGKPSGSIADFTCFSFHAVKNFTVAEGGSVTWNRNLGLNDDEIYREFQLLSLHGQSKDALSKTKLGSWEYDIVAPNYKCNLTDIASGIGLAQLKRYPSLLKRRFEIVERYNKGFEGTRIKPFIHFEEDRKSCCHLYIVNIEGASEEDRNEIIVKMAERGIATNVHYKPLPMHTAYKNLGFDIKDYPNAFDNYKSEITLPLHTLLTDEQVDYIIENLKALV
ncbi:DegT/DnrJ/EryC1/StrS family aminotransferase, partial [Parvimonas micra]